MLLKIIPEKGNTKVCAFLEVGQCRVWAGLPNRAKLSTTDSLQPPYFTFPCSSLLSGFAGENVCCSPILAPLP